MQRIDAVLVGTLVCSCGTKHGSETAIEPPSSRNGESVERPARAVVQAAASTARPPAASAVEVCDRFVEFGYAERGSGYFERFNRFDCVARLQVVSEQGDPRAFAKYARCCENATGLQELEACDRERPPAPEDEVAEGVQAECVAVYDNYVRILKVSDDPFDRENAEFLQEKDKRGPFIDECINRLPAEVRDCLKNANDEVDMLEC